MATVENAIKKITEVLEKLQSNQGNSGSDCRGLQLQPFDENQETFENYMQRLENYLELRNLKDDTPENEIKCARILINCIGPKIYQTLASLTAPKLPKNKKFKDLTEILRKHFYPKSNEVAEQHKFSMRIQHEGESIANFQAELRKLANNCNFTCEHCKKSTMATHLRSQLIRGVRDHDIRERLLQEDSKTKFEDAVKLAQNIEASKLESREMQGQSHTVHSVNKEKKARNGERTKRQQSNTKHRKKFTHIQPTKIKCFRCGKPNHKASECTAKRLKCANCNKDGHVKSVCMSKHTADQRVIEINVTDHDSSDDNTFYINSVMDCNIIEKGKFFIDVMLNDKPIQMEFDTGAAVTSLSYETFKRLCPDLILRKTPTLLKTYTGEKIYPKGVCKVKITLKDKVIYSNVYVLGQDVSSIMGRDLIRQLGLDAKLIHQVQ